MIRIAISFLLLTTALSAADYGPEKGTLVIVGGNMQDPAIVKRFIDLAGGPDAPIVIIPTAGEADDEYGQYWSGLKLWRENGAQNLTVLHTRDRKVADSEAFVKPIREARGVFFGGGRQWRLADSYLNTLTHKELTALLNRGGVVGGSSAGASILGIGYLLPMAYLAWSLRYGKVVGSNPWGAVGLEWTIQSPPLTENFTETPTVTWDAYDYKAPVNSHVA